MRAALTWVVLIAAAFVPLWFAVKSPLLAWREPVYIVAGCAGVVGLVLMLFQPLLASGWVPGLRLSSGRRVHRWLGGALVLAITVHVGGLWITSPPDVIDALLFVSPTPFSDWGVVAMWALFAAGGLAFLRNRLTTRAWRLGHTGLVILAVVSTVPHAMLIEGTMETISKAVLCFLVLGAALAAVARWKAWKARPSV